MKKWVRRTPARAIWEHDHKWGPQITDRTPLRVERSDGGALTVRYGSEKIEIRKDLVGVFGQMISNAVNWSDEDEG